MRLSTFSALRRDLEQVFFYHLILSGNVIFFMLFFSSQPPSIAVKNLMHSLFTWDNTIQPQIRLEVGRKGISCKLGPLLMTTFVFSSSRSFLYGQKKKAKISQRN
jgi:hypothetical protein